MFMLYYCNVVAGNLNKTNMLKLCTLKALAVIHLTTEVLLSYLPNVRYLFLTKIILKINCKLISKQLK